jgi:hypothetical protein
VAPNLVQPTISNRILQLLQEDFVMDTVNNVANFNGQRPVIDPAMPF